VKLFVLVFDFSTEYDPRDYGNLKLRLQVARARCLFGEVYALRSDQTAAAIKDSFRLALRPYDHLFVGLVSDFATRRAAFDLKEF
jgi:hypothetical protein